MNITLRRVVPVFALAVAIGHAPPAKASQQRFVVDLASDPASLDPQLQWDPDSYAVYRNVFDNLVTRDPSGKIVGQVASTWHYKSPTEVVFTIRNDIRFQDGSKLTPADVVFSIQRITNPAFKSPQLSQFDEITSAAVTGPNQVTITTKTPYPVLLAQLVKLSIVPKTYVQKLGNTKFNEHPMGSGPYRFVSRVQGVKIDLAANEGYWRGKPPFARVVMHPVLQESTRIADVRTGKADITRILSTDDANALRSDKQVKVLWTPTERVTMLALNALSGPMQDIRVREAAAMAIDKTVLVKALLSGYAKPVNEPLTPASFGFDPNIPDYGYNPVRARELLKEAGVTPQTKFVFLTSPVFDQRVVQALQQMLANVGINAKIVTVDLATYLHMREGTPKQAGDVSFFRWSCGCEDADGTLFPLFNSSSVWAKYKNLKVDKLLSDARATLDPKKRIADYAQALTIIHKDVPVVPLYQDVVMFVARNQVQFQPTADESFFLFSMGWKK